VRAHLLNGLLALVFSILIWSAVGAQLSDVATVKVNYVISVPPDVTVTYNNKHSALELPIPIEVDVRGPREVVSRLTPNEVSARRTFAHTETFLRDALQAGGPRPLEISLADIVVARPGVEVIAVREPQLDIAFSQVKEWETRALPPQVIGTPAEGFMVAKMPTTDRTRVTVRGPSSIEKNQGGPYEVEAVDVSGERVPVGDAKYELKVTRGVKTPLGVTCDTRVSVTVTIVPVPVTKLVTFPIRVLHSHQGELLLEPLDVIVEPQPPQQDWYYAIPLKGPARELDDLIQRLDRERRNPGSHSNLPVAYIPVDEIPREGNLSANPDIIVLGLPEGITRDGSRVQFPIRTKPLQ
jgi:hypothetical protein